MIISKFIANLLSEWKKKYPQGFLNVLIFSSESYRDVLLICRFSTFYTSVDQVWIKLFLFYSLEWISFLFLKRFCVFLKELEKKADKSDDENEKEEKKGDEEEKKGDEEEEIEGDEFDEELEEVKRMVRSSWTHCWNMTKIRLNLRNA